MISALGVRGRAATNDQLARVAAMLKNHRGRLPVLLRLTLPVSNSHLGTGLRLAIGQPLLLPLQPRHAPRVAHKGGIGVFQREENVFGRRGGEKDCS